MWYMLVYFINGFGKSRHNLTTNKLYHTFVVVNTVFSQTYHSVRGICRASFEPCIWRWFQKLKAYWAGYSNSITRILDTHISPAVLSGFVSHNLRPCCWVHVCVLPIHLHDIWFLFPSHDTSPFPINFFLPWFWSQIMTLFQFIFVHICHLSFTTHLF